MNLLLVTLVSVVLATWVFNTEPKDSEVNKKTEIIVKDTLKKKSAKEKVKSEEIAQAEAEAKAAAMKDRVMRKFVSDADDEDNADRKGKVIIDGQPTGGSGEEKAGSEDDELDGLEKEAEGGIGVVN